MPRPDLESSAIQTFRDRFGAEPTLLARAPGRVELLGNHTDYNGGLVMAAAIDRFTIVAGRPAGPGTDGRVFARAFQEELTLPLAGQEAPPPPTGDSWGRYVRGVAALMLGRLTTADGHARAELDTLPFPTTGYEAVIAGDIPIGAGLSSSASLEAAFAVFLDALDPPAGGGSRFATDAQRMQLAEELKQVENHYVGVGCGLLDQFSVIFGRLGHALFLDCRSEDFDRLPLGNSPPAIVICDSKTSRRLADGMYNQRRAECERVVDYFQRLPAADHTPDEPPGVSSWWRRLLFGEGHTDPEPPRVTSLRSIRLDDLLAHWDRLDPVGRKRARHVLTENDRVRKGAEALHRGDVETLGRLMSGSHASSRDDFENSSPALDALIECAERSPGFLGGKLSGAGWAGCTVNLVRAGEAEAFAEAVRSDYEVATGTVPDIHICHAADGATAVLAPG
jgi:galactokinase